MKQIEYRKILVTHDGSRLAAAALPHALFLAKGLNTEVFLLRVVESVGQKMVTLEPMGMVPAVSVVGTTAVEIVKEDEKIAKEQLKRVKIELEGNGARWVETRVVEGVPAQEIVTVAKEEKVDVIIMSTHGRSGLRRVLLGSVADYVVRHANCPVLLVRPQKDYL